MTAVRLSDVRKTFSTGSQPIQAVDGISLDIAMGDRLGIIGPNGAGKSTLLQLIAGLTEATSGEVTVAGHVTAVMTLGVGLRDHATGRENIYLDGELQGRSRSEIHLLVDEVIAFAELGDFIDQPVRTYSTGMKARLAFSMLCHIDPEILIIDEALSVGDAAFSRKAGAKIREICARGRIVILVSHSMSAVREMCNRCLWLEAGRVVMDGRPDEVTARYIDAVRQADQQTALARFSQSAGQHSWRDGWQVSLALNQGGPADLRLLEAGAPLRIRITGHGPDVAGASIGVGIVRLDGLRMFAEEFAAADYSDRAGYVDFSVLMEPLAIGPGIYRVDAMLHSAGERAAESSIVCEVYAPVPPSGGKPMLMYPVHVDVVKVGEC